MSEFIRICTRQDDSRVSTYCINKKWFTFLRYGGLLVQTLETDSFLFAGENHLSLAKKIILKEKSNEQSSSIEIGIKPESEASTEETTCGQEGTEQNQCIEEAAGSLASAQESGSEASSSATR